jgi:hypothetical protein
MGGFPGPGRIFVSLLRFVTPKAAQKFTELQRNFTMMPSVQTIESRKVPWLKRIDKLVIWRNSEFRTETLSDEQLEELGGAEYKALTMLCYVIPAVSSTYGSQQLSNVTNLQYFILWQLFPVLLFLPWLMVTKSYDFVFIAQPRLVGKPWFSFFMVMAAYSGGGLSLVDLFVRIFMLCTLD